MKFKFFAASSLFLASVSCFASGKNLVVCGWNSNDDQVSVREDVGGQTVALLSMLDHGTLPYKVELVPVPHHNLGAGVTYEGQGLSLHINTDGPANKDGFYSTLSVPSLDIQNEELRCKILN